VERTYLYNTVVIFMETFDIVLGFCDREFITSVRVEDTSNYVIQGVICPQLSESKQIVRQTQRIYLFFSLSSTDLSTGHSISSMEKCLILVWRLDVEVCVWTKESRGTDPEAPTSIATRLRKCSKSL
jgi:hypothetical protein